ncbi:MAG: type II toxin-antitoxin system Phd/YefM family antitoxin [Acidobacteria bacterium]|nr:type II toxin-antitoxin system Phd/YefM family antitoxin [Acidobacteriota bacterium]MYG74978.1 type II toxin-antitoxin system Phd/YefM family antitoxin [Acidobacteriota bacterium]
MSTLGSERDNARHSCDFAAPERVWTVAEAKSRLSELLRRASEVGPQQIGVQRPHVVVPLDQWLVRAGPDRKFGRWLVENAPRGCEIELPSREDGDREIPFANLDWGAMTPSPPGTSAIL